MINTRWSVTRLYFASICDRMHYYGYYTDEKKLPSAWTYARGHLFHNLTRRFFRVDGKPFRKSAESFANTAVAEWKLMIKRKHIDWQGKNPYSLIGNIREIATTLYNTYSQQTPPILTELAINFNLNRIPFISVFDEVRNNLTLRDHKTSPIPKITITQDYQPTIYIVGFIAALSQDPDFAKINKISSETAYLWLKEPETLCDKVNFEYHIIRTGEIINATRSFQNIEEMLNTIELKKNSIDRALKKDKLPDANRGYHCGSCDFRDACLRDSSKSEKSIVYQPELILFEKPSTKIKGLEIKQLKIKFPRKIRKM